MSLRRAVVASVAALALSTGTAQAALPGEPVVQDAARFADATLGVPPRATVVQIDGFGARLVNAGAWAEVAVTAGERRITLTRGVAASLHRLGRGTLGPRGADSARVALHEVLHQPGQSGPLEEGVVDAVALDLLPAFLHRYGWWSRSASSYPVEVRMVRWASARATGGSWRSREARLWRRQLLLADTAGRAAMLAPRP